VIPTAFSLMKKWDKKAAQRPDIFIANSRNTQERIKKYYGRESTVVYPFFIPVKSSKLRVPSFSSDKQLGTRHSALGTYFVCLGRVVPYKRFDLAILACNELKIPLKIFTSTINDEVKRLQDIS
jgi:glycosyltransferase involved in cell wall biosynthesis